MDREAILRELQPMGSLGEVIRWAMARTPRAEFVDVIVQDEFTHDVVVKVNSEIYAVFDTT
jgi:hypothetical protein